MSALFEHPAGVFATVTLGLVFLIVSCVALAHFFPQAKCTKSLKATNIEKMDYTMWKITYEDGSMKITENPMSQTPTTCVQY